MYPFHIGRTVEELVKYVLYILFRRLVGQKLTTDTTTQFFEERNTVQQTSISKKNYFLFISKYVMKFFLEESDAIGFVFDFSDEFIDIERRLFIFTFTTKVVHYIKQEVNIFIV